MRRLRSKLAKLARRDPADRWLLLRAALWLLAVDLGLWTLGFGRVRDLLGRLVRRRGMARAAGPAAERLTTAVAVAARYHLYPMRCLARSLVLQYLLAREGVETDLRIGVRVEDGRFAGHAWLERDGRPLAEPVDVDRRFAAVSLPRP